MAHLRGRNPVIPKDTITFVCNIRQLLWLDDPYTELYKWEHIADGVWNNPELFPEKSGTVIPIANTILTSLYVNIWLCLWNMLRPPFCVSYTKAPQKTLPPDSYGHLQWSFCTWLLKGLSHYLSGQRQFMRQLKVSMLETDEVLLISHPLIWFAVFLSWKTLACHKSDRPCSRCTAFIITVLQGFSNSDLGLQT